MSGIRRRLAAAFVAVIAVAAGAAALAGAPVAALLVAIAAAAILAVGATAWLGRDLARSLEAVRLRIESIGRGAPARPPPLAWPVELRPAADALERLAERTARRVGESEEERAHLGTIIEAMAEAVLVVDREGRVVLGNPQLRALFSCPPDLEGRPLLEVVRQPALAEILRRALRGGPPERCEIPVDGVPELWLRVHAASFPGDGPPRGAVAVFHDVGEIRRLENVRREFVANASHELKTPLTAIRGFAERLAERELGDPEAAQAARTILAHAERLGALIEDLLELSRIESASLRFEAEPVDAAGLVAGLLEELQPRLRGAGISGKLEVQGDSHLLGDRRALEHVLSNLLDNALKHTEPEGTVRVTLRDAGSRLRIDVADTGIGIPARDLPRVFERFFRVDPARSRALGGTGLGLSIAKHLVQSMGGEISAQSRLGRGSTFTVVLPRTPPAVAPRTSGPAAPAPAE